MAKPKSGRAGQVATKLPPAPAAAVVTRPAYLLGFGTLPPLLCFFACCALMFYAPSWQSGFWPSTYDYIAQSMLLSITGCICLLMALRPAAAGPGPKAPLGLVGGLLLAFYGWCVLGAATTVYLHDTLLELSRVGVGLLWFFIGRALLAGAGLHAARRRWLVLGAVVLGAALVGVPAFIKFLRENDPRQFGTFYNPNLFANYCALALPLALAWYIEGQRQARQRSAARLMLGVAGMAATVGILLGLFSTSSKGGLIALGVGLLVFGLALARARSGALLQMWHRRGPVLAVVAIVVLLASAAVLRKTVLPRLRTMGAGDNSTMFRAYTWQGTWAMARARPLLGWGPGSFPSAYTQFAITGYTRSAHELWLQIAAEDGWPAALLLLAACAAGAWRGWRALRGPSWPVAAGALGALAAFATHGLMDAGWGVTSILLLLMLVLALLDSVGATPASTSLPVDDGALLNGGVAVATPSRSSLDWRWLALSLWLAFAAGATQRAVAAEDAHAQARASMDKGAASLALQAAREATSDDPLCARMYVIAGDAEALAGLDPRASFARAAALQPTHAANWSNLARVAIRDGDMATAANDYARALLLDPNDTSILLERGEWLLGRGDARGWDDLARIALLADAPLGRYPATEQVVNLDFPRALVKLGRHLLSLGQRKQAQADALRGLEFIRQAQHFALQEQQFAEAMRGTLDVQDVQDVSDLETQLDSLKEATQ